MKRLADIRTMPAQNGIVYSIKAVNRNSPSPFDAGSRSRSGTFGQNLQMANEYIIYVRKSDYNNATEIIGG